MMREIYNVFLEEGKVEISEEVGCVSCTQRV